MLENKQVPPDYCEYASGTCDQSFVGLKESKGLFLYPSDPQNIACTFEQGLQKLRECASDLRWASWRDLGTGQLIFCSVCKAIRHANLVVADVTTLNFNLLFEIGFSLGLELPLILARDTSYEQDGADFEDLGLLDTVRYLDFVNSDQLVNGVIDRLNAEPIPAPPADIDYDAPLYVLKGPLSTEGEVRLNSTLKKSMLRFRSYDTVETPRLSLHEVRKQVAKSLGVVAHLLSSQRRGARVHNARCALASGIALASGKIVLMLHEGNDPQPIDYRDIVVPYSDPTKIERLVEPTILKVIQALQTRKPQKLRLPKGFLQQLDIGDVAAENEIRPLRSYFLQTGQYNEARRGYARLVVGRKGSGKTAIFYAVRDSFGKSQSRVVLDLKPEGFQFTKLREAVLSTLSAGMQEHTLTAFWNLILLAELAHRIVTEEYAWAHREPDRADRYDSVEKLYRSHGFAEKGDFSERLLNQVNRLASQFESIIAEGITPIATQHLFTSDIKDLGEAIGKYLEEKDEVWLLVDNLDKSWPTQGALPADILIIRTLMEATRKLQRELEKVAVDFHCLVFLRNDIFEHLIRQTSDKGKDTAISLDWSDPELFREMFRLRVASSGDVDGTFEEAWAAVFEPNVGTQSSFEYILERTLLRPRDFLSFVHRAIEVAINRGHEKVRADDLRQAEQWYSEDLLQAVSFEIRDVYPRIADVIYEFYGAKPRLRKNEVLELLAKAGVDEDELDKALRLLVWFGFLGVSLEPTEHARFSFGVRYDVTKLMTSVDKGNARLVVHPAFRTALECTPE